MIVINLFAIFLILAGILLLIKPVVLFGFLDSYAQSLSLYIVAIVARLILGSLLILYASLSRFPQTMAIIGAISILAALVFTAIGWSGFKQLMSRVTRHIRPMGRFGGVLSLGLGLLLLYSFV